MVVANGGEVRVPRPSWMAWASMWMGLAGRELSTVTETGAEVPTPPEVSVAVAVRLWVPSATASVSQNVANGGLVTGAPTATSSR